MRILVLHSRYRSGPASGENRVVEDETRLLAEAGHDVEQFTPSVGEPRGWELIRAGTRVIWARDAAKEVRRHITAFRPDVIHCHNLFPALSPAILRSVGDRAPVVMTLHNYRLHCLPGNLFRDGHVCEDCVARLPWPGVVHGCYQGSVPASLALGTSITLHRRLGTFDSVRRFFAISEFVRTKHIEAGFLPSQVVVKPHFVWPSELRNGPGDHFLFLGRLAPEKGAETLVRAWQGIDAELVIAGDGPQAEYLRSIAPSSVRFTSTISPARAQDLIRSARAVLVPSLWYEGAGRVVLEAYSSGVPVAASRIGALPEVVEDGVTGLLLSPADTRAWSAAVQDLLDDSTTERMGEAAFRLWNERFTPERGLARLEELYTTSMDGERRGP